MSEYISKQEAIEAFSDMSDGTPITHGDMISDTTAVNVIKSIPSADVRENIHGHWELVNPLQSNDGGAYRCSVCGTGDWHIRPKYWKGCPWCLAIMDGEPKGEKGTE